MALKTSIGWLELEALTTTPSDTDANRYGFCIVSGSPYYWDGSSWTAFSSGAGSSSFDPIYDADKLLLMDGGMLEFRMTTEATGLYLNKTDVASGSVLKLANSGTGLDLEGPAWSIISTGSVGILELTSGGTINATGGALTIGKTGTATSFSGTATIAEGLTLTAGALTHSAGQTTLIDTSNVAASLLVTNNTVTTYGAGPVASAGVAVIRSTSLTTGTLLKLQLTEGTLNGGYYLDCYDVTGSAVVFKIGEDGATTILGAASANALTITNGDVLISDGSITMTDADNAASFTLTNNTATTASVFVLAGSGVFTGSTTSSWMTITPSGLTTGTAVYMPLAGMTTGKGLQIVANAVTTGEVLDISHTTSVIADGGSLVRISSTGIDTGGATNGVLLDLSSTASTAGVQVLGTFSALTTGTGISIITSALTTGTALSLVNASGVMTTTGEMLNVAANAATTCTGIVRISGTGLTDGFAMEITGGGANATASGGVVNLNAGAATVGSALKITTSGVYTGTTGVIDLNAASATTGTIMDIGAAGLTSGIALKITATEATLTTGYYIDCYDGAAIDFSVGKYGATVIAGNAATNVLTLTAGNEVITAGNLVLTAGTIIETAQAILNANTAISVTHGVTKIANNAPSTHTLADGVEGQRKTIVCTVYTGDAVITPSNLANGTTITLNAVNDACDLVFLGTEWFVINLYGTAAVA